MRDETERLLTLVLAVILVLSLAGVAYVSLGPFEPEDPFTEFYILGENGTAEGYPTNMTVGEQSTVLVGVSNHEGQEQAYTMVVRMNELVLHTDTLTIADEETWERPVSFALDSTGEHRVRFLLYKGEQSSGEPYRQLRLWVTVRSQ